MGRRALALVIATVVALVGVVALLVYANSADQRAVAAQSPTTAWLSTAAVPTGTTLKKAVADGLISETTVAAKGVPAGALEKVDAANEDLVATTDIPAGEFILAARFSDKPQGTKALDVPKGMVAVSVELNDPARVGKFVTPGSHIAIFDTYKVKALGESDAAKALNEADIHSTSVLLDDVLVIGMGETALAPKDPPAGAKSTSDQSGQSDAASFLVTVAVSPGDAAKLVHGINNGTLYAALRGDGAKVDDAPRVDDLNLFDLSGVGQ